MIGRVVDLIAKLAEACSPALTVRDSAAVAVRALADLFPGSSAVIFEREGSSGHVRVVAGANIPSRWNMRAVSLAEVPLFATALRHPERLLQTIAVQGRPTDQFFAPQTQVICGAVPDAAEALYLVTLLAPLDAAQQEERELAVETVRHSLRAVAAIVAGNSARARTLAAIHHSKLEWENVADALPELVGLLNARGRVVRVGRTLERWSLGNVRNAIGRDLHAVLHRSCRQDECALHGALLKAWAELGSADSAQLELTDPVLGLDLVIELRATRRASPGASAEPGDASPWRRVAFIVSNVTRLRVAERELRQLNQTLEHKVAERTTEISAANRSLRDEVGRRREAETSLRKSETELANLSAQLMAAQEDERKRIAQDLHDSVGQSLSAVKYSLERAQVLMRRQDAPGAGAVMELAVERVRRVIDDVRCISMNLRPPQLDDLGAASAVRWLCREWHDIYDEIAIDTDITVADSDIPAPLGTNVFRAVQESLNNVARHSAARRVRVALKLEEGTLSVAVQDDGSGFALNGDVRRLVETGGLRGLRERAERTGGRCEVASAPGAGTMVRLEWPVAQGHVAQVAQA